MGGIGRRLTAAALVDGGGACGRERAAADVRRLPVDSGGPCGGRRKAADVWLLAVDRGGPCRGRTMADVGRTPVDSGGPYGGRRSMQTGAGGGGCQAVAG